MFFIPNLFTFYPFLSTDKLGNPHGWHRNPETPQTGTINWNSTKDLSIQDREMEPEINKHSCPLL